MCIFNWRYHSVIPDASNNSCSFQCALLSCTRMDNQNSYGCKLLYFILVDFFYLDNDELAGGDYCFCLFCPYKSLLCEWCCRSCPNWLADKSLEWNGGVVTGDPECKIRVESWFSKMANQSKNWPDILSIVWPSNIYYYSSILTS